MRLTDRFDDSITIDGKDYALDLSFDNVLRIYELKDDDEIDDYTKIEYMFEMLVIGGESLDLSIEQKSMIVEKIFDTFILVESKYKDQQETQNAEESAKKIWDINKDAELIYASFLFDYQIDLFEQQGKLHWRKFVALLNGLSENSPFMQVVKIRTMEVPKANKYNAKEREMIRKLKRIYALEQEPSGIDSAFDAIARRLGKAGEANGRRTNTD